MRLHTGPPIWRNTIVVRVDDRPHIFAGDVRVRVTLDRSGTIDCPDDAPEVDVLEAAGLFDETGRDMLEIVEWDGIDVPDGVAREAERLALEQAFLAADDVDESTRALLAWAEVA